MKLLVPVALLAAALTSLGCSSEDESTGNEPVVFLSGVNAHTGELDVQAINLFSLEGCERTGITGTVDGAVGMPVRVLDVREECEPVMFEVETFGANAGERGWVSELLIRE